MADWFAPKSEASASADAYVIEIELSGVDHDDMAGPDPAILFFAVDTIVKRMRRSSLRTTEGVE